MPSDQDRCGNSWRQLTFVFLALCLLHLPLAMSNQAYAEIVIEAGQHALLPNTPNQRIDIRVRSTDATNDPLISGLNLNVEIGDGTGVLSEPVFQGAEGTLEGIDFSTSIFAGNPPSGAGPAAGFPQLISGGIVSETNVVASGVLVSLLIDTTSFSQAGESYAIRLASHLSPFPMDTQILGPLGNASPTAVTINNGLLAIASQNTLAGDYNQDGDVDAIDLAVWRDGFGTISPIGTGADGNGNGSIDGADFLIWQRNFGNSLPSSHLAVGVKAVPEPQTASLFASSWVIFALICRIRWKNRGFSRPGNALQNCRSHLY